MASLRHTPLVWTMLLGISAGLTVASKHSGAFSVAPLFAALGLLALIRRDGRGIGRLVLSGVIALGVFIALNPAWWPAPIDIAREVLRLRSELLAEQTASFGGYVTLGDQVSGFVQYAIAETPQYYEVDGWQDWIGGQIAAYESSPWTPPPLLNIVRAVVLIVCMALGVIAVIRRRREPGVMVAALWIAGVVLAVFALTPLPWARYYLPALPALYTLAALGIGSIRKR